MNDDFASKITRQIADRALKPRSRFRFLATSAAFWTLTVLATLIGAISVATLIFYFTDKGRTGGKGFDAMPLDDFFEVVPYFWLAFLSVATISATVAFRATPRGFLWRPASVFGLILFASAAGGTLMFASGLGPFLNREFADHIPGYARIVAVEDWRNISPDQGRLVGESLGLSNSGQLLLRDFAGREWIVAVDSAALSLDEPLGSDEDLDILGTRTGPSAFAATAISDWD